MMVGGWHGRIGCYEDVWQKVVDWENDKLVIYERDTLDGCGIARL